MRVSSVRETLAFVRDAAAFTAGPGLRLGDVYRVGLPGRRLHVVTDPEVAEQILVRRAKHFQKSRIYWRDLRRNMGESIATLEGASWEAVHEKERPFFTPEAVRSYLPAVVDQARLHFERLADRSEHPRVALLEVLAELNASIILATVFGRPGDPASEEIARRLVDGHAIVTWRSKLPWRPATGWLNGANWRLRAHRRWLNAYADCLGKSLPPSDPPRLLHALMGLDTAPEVPRFDGTFLRGEIAFHLGAGTETLATATAWVIYLLWKHPHALRRLCDELTTVAGSGAISSEHVPSLVYARQVVQEAMRLYPPAYAIMRDCTEPLRLGGFTARRGDAFFISVCGLHRHPRLWTEPESFVPERFHPDRAAAIGRCQYIPFGAGRRACIGRHLAIPAMVLVVAQFAQQFDWRFVGPEIRPRATSSLKPSGPFTAALTRRPSAPRLTR